MTGWIPDVVPGQTIESAWGNQIRDRTVHPFADAVARAAAIPTPKTGMLAFLDDVNRIDVYNGAQWEPLSVPRFATAAERDAAFPAPAWGTLVWVTERFTYQRWLNAWQSVTPAFNTPPAIGAAIAGGAALIQAGNAVVSVNAGGAFNLTYPQAFPGFIAGMILGAGDLIAGTYGYYFTPVFANCSLANWNGVVHSNTGGLVTNSTIRLNYIVIGG